MVKRERRPGGGRKRDGEFAKTTNFQARIDAETSRALDEAVKAGRWRSRSELAEYLLKQGLKKPDAAVHNISLGVAVALLADRAESGTGKGWRNDPWTGMALRSAVEILLFRFAPPSEESPPTPAAIEEAAARRPPGFAKWFGTPENYGLLIADNLVLEIEQAVPPVNPNEWSMPIFLGTRPAQLSLINRDLMRPKDKQGKTK
jgi:Arc/MetJ-type ribon-helix-helix transcriptional regulator